VPTIDHWLNAREQAVVIWTVVLLAWALVAVPSIRPGLWSLTRLAVSPPLGVMFAVSMAYTAAVTLALNWIGMLYPTAVKDVVIWYCGVGVPLLFKASTRRQALQGTVRDAITLTALLTFIVGLYVFPLVVELVIVPAVALVVMMHVAASMQKEFAEAASILNITLTALGLGVLIYALIRAAADPRTLIAADTWEQFILPAELTAAFLPFGAGLAWYIRRDADRTRRRFVSATGA
jgi:hypothetical protein